MNVRLLHPAGRHSRTGTDALADTIRHVLLRLFVGALDPNRDEFGPVERGMTEHHVREREWHAITCRIGALVEQIVSLLTVALVGLAVLAAGAVAVAYAPLWLSITGFAAVVLVCGWRLAVASRPAQTAITEELSGVGDEPTVTWPAMELDQGKENGL